MASVKICDLDGQAFIERAPNSVRINDAVIYDDNGKPQQFSGELCPSCGRMITQTRSNFQGNLMLPPPIDIHDSES